MEHLCSHRAVGHPSAWWMWDIRLSGLFSTAPTMELLVFFHVFFIFFRFGPKWNFALYRDCKATRFRSHVEGFRFPFRFVEPLRSTWSTWSTARAHPIIFRSARPIDAARTRCSQAESPALVTRFLQNCRLTRTCSGWVGAPRIGRGAVARPWPQNSVHRHA